MSKEKKFAYEDYGSADYELFLPEPKRGAMFIKVEEHKYKEEGKEKRNVSIELGDREAIHHATILMPFKEFKKLVASGQEFLKHGKTVVHFSHEGEKIN